MLYVFGDSHSAVWGGKMPEGFPITSVFPQVNVHHLGAALAYNLMSDDGTPGKWGQQILATLDNHAAPTSIMLCFGEIDCRSHIFKHASSQKISVDQATESVIARYIQFVRILRARTQAPIFLWSPVPSARDFCDWDPSYPYVGSQQERNLITKTFIALMARESHNIPDVFALDIFDQLTVSGTLSKAHYFPDNRHLGPEGLELGIAAFNAAVKANNLGLPDYFNAQTPTGRPARIKDISSSARITRMSSAPEGVPTRIDQPREGTGYVFHTNEDDKPFVLIDLGYSAILRQIIIHNRAHAHKDRARSLEILIGDNPNNAALIYQHKTNAFDNGDMPIDLKFEGAPPTRYVLLRLREKQHFHLGKISLFAESFTG